MDVCPNTFSAGPPLLPRLIPVSSEWTYVDPLLDVVLTFDEPMFDGITPPPGVFTLDVDGTDKTPTTLTWDSTTELSIEYSEVILAPTVVRCRLPAKHNDLKSNTSELVTPFDILVTPA